MPRSKPVGGGAVSLAVAFALALLAAACSGGSSDGGSATSAPAAVTIATATTAPGGTTATTATTGTAATATRCDGTRTGGTVAYARRPGTPADRTSLDLYVPRPARCAPVFVFVHGGGYCCGDKANDIGGPARWLNASGWIVASVNYRLTQGPGAARYPDFLFDVVDAVRWLRANVGRWGGDGRRIVLAGHSTGGDMVALLGTDASLWRRQPAGAGAAAGAGFGALRCVVVLDGSGFDLAAVMRAGGGAARVYRQAYGSDPNVWREASAVVRAGEGPVVPRWFVATRPGERPLKLQLQRAFVGSLRRAGAEVAVVDARAIGHGAVIKDIGKPGDRVMTGPIAAFLAGC